ncbi:MAG TPA: choice-of-anchor J domain-containing protein [bacterium]|nr:choice-of-anchor J domain-containing protein [bacterium]
MKRKLTVLMLLLLSASVISFGTVINSETFNGGLGTWTQYSVTGSQSWYQDDYDNDYFAKMSGYDSGSNENEDWLISPGFVPDDYENPIMYFQNAYNYSGPDLQLMVSTDYDGTSDPSTQGTWTDITDQATWSSGSFNWASSGDIDLSSYSGTTYVAFKYTSTADESKTWEVDDIVIAEDKPLGHVTFQVNMSAQIENGTFDPSSDFVDVTGGFAGWGSSLHQLQDLDGDSVYTTTVAIDTGSIEYKYRLNGNWDVAEGRSNRTYDVVEGDNEIPLVWWDDYNPNAVLDAEIYFSVDMSIQLMNGNFQPDSGDIAVVRGALNEWSGEDDQLTEDPATEGLYTYSYEMDSVALDADNQYKFVIVPGEGSDMWESIDNRSFSIPMDHDYTDSDGDGYVEVALDTVYFNNVGMEDIVTQDVTTYFTVDISSAINALNAGEVLIDSQTDADTISSVDEIDAVYINGLYGQWWDWGAAPEEYKMYDDGTHGDETAGDNVYTTDILYTAGQSKEVTYKYGINSLDNEAGFAENRSMTLDDANSTFDPETDCFGEQNTDDRLPFPEYTCGEQATTVTFQVNMSAQIDNGTFDPASDVVGVAGSINGWGDPSDDQLSDTDGDSIYTTTVEVDTGTIEYKYRLNNSWDVAESISNRTYTVVPGVNEIPVVWWNNFNPNAIVDAEIYFSVDMRIQLMNGNFMPDSGDIAVVRGALNEWSGEDDQLTEDPATEGLYTYSKEMDSLALGAGHEYKFVIVPGDDSGDMWESIDNRSVTVPMDHDYTDSDGDGYVEVALDTVYFNNVGMEDIVTQDVTTYFTVDISSAINALEAGEVLIDSQTDADTISTVDEIDAVYINGLFGQWWDWGAAPEDYKMYDDGTHGDETAGDNIYTTDILYTAGQSREVTYKYGINSLDNEAGFAENRTLTIDDANSTFDPEIDCFGSQNTDDRLPFPEYTCDGSALDEETAAIPEDYMLYDNYPNPSTRLLL